MKLALIWAQDENGVIAINNDIPWYIPEDLIRFKEYTLGTAVVMGRKTWESLPVKPLPKRKNYVLSRNLDFILQRKGLGVGVVTASSLQTAANHAAAEGIQAMIVIGGAEVYREALPLAEALLITTVHTKVPYSEKDDVVKFPTDGFNKADWVRSIGIEKPNYTFEILVRSSENKGK